VLPPLNFQATASGFVTLGLAADYVKDIPFTGMAVHRRWAAANLPVAKRILTATDKSIAWLADPSHRDEAIELLVKVARSSKEDAEASYDYLRRIEFFEPSSKVSRTKLRNLVAMEQRAGTVNPAFAIDRLSCQASLNSRIDRKPNDSGFFSRQVGGYLGQVAIDRIAAQLVPLKKKRFS
jgi:hypothetical protein